MTERAYGTMKSLVKAVRGKGLVYQQSEIPEPKEGEVLIRILYAAICGTDLQIYNWDKWAAEAGIQVPGISGHECAGKVVQTGTNTSSFKEGDLVSVESHIPCGECESCLSGKPHICDHLKYFGLHIDGCFAEWAVVPEVCLRKVPPSIPAEVAAVLEPLGVGVHAAQVGEVQGKTGAVLGSGPIGLYSACATQALEAEKVYISDLKQNRLDVALSCGDFFAFNPLETPVPSIFNYEDPIDVGIETTGNAQALNDIIQFIKNGGKVILAGLYSKDDPVDLSAIVTKEIHIQGIHGRRLWDTWDLTEQLLLDGKLKIMPSITHQLPLEEYKRAFEMAMNGYGVKILLRP